MSERPHLSIGEVLSLLQDEFPDITISKIRFLESQGLLDPERTPSGYRKFYEEDLARLRWILTQQRDHFLPLKVIKDRLDSGFEPEPTADRADSPNGVSAASEDEGPRTAVEPTGSDEPAPTGVARGNGNGTSTASAPLAQPDESVSILSAGAGTGAGTGSGRGAGTGSGTGTGAGAGSTPRASSEGRQAPDEPAPGSPPPRETRYQARAQRAAAAPDRSGQETGWEPRSRGAASRPVPRPAVSEPDEPARPPQDLSSVSLSLTELAGACGLEVEDVRELERFGLVCGQRVGSDLVYGDEALLAAQLAARFRRHGIEARHLRQYRMSAEKEMALFEQVVAPLLRAREPGSGNRAVETLTQLGELGDSLRKVLVRRAMREYLGGE